MRSVTTDPKIASPRNSSLSLCGIGSVCSNANERCVRASSYRGPRPSGTPRTASPAVSLLSLDGLSSGVEATVRAHAMGQLRLAALRAGGVGRSLYAPVRAPHAHLRSGLASLGYGHGLLLVPPLAQLLAQGVQLRPAGVGFLLEAVAAPHVEAAAAPCAQARALLPAQRMEG